MTDIFVYTSNRKDATAVKIDYAVFVDLVNEFFNKDYLNDDNDFLQFKRNVVRHSNIICARDNNNVMNKAIKREQNAFKLSRNKQVLLDRATRAKSASENLEYMDEQGFYIPKTEGILGFNYTIDDNCQDDVIINTRLSLTVDIGEVGEFVEELEALMKKYNVAISETANIEITDTALENAFSV
jgi:hypothetical protein